MTAKNTLEHKSERLEEAAEYASSARNNDWNKSNFGEDFRKELQAINGDAALAFDKQTDMAGFPPDKREEYLSAYAQGFNKLDFATHSDRRDAATGLAQNIYKPLFEKVELAEAGISQGAAAQLKQMGYDKAEKHTIIDGDGKLAEQTMIMARTEKDAEKIALLTGGEVLAQNRILDFHLTQQCDEFAAALYQGRLDPGAAGRRMNESFSRAMELIGSEQEYPEGRENEPRTVDFRWVEETRDEESRKRALDFLAGENWEDSLKALDELKKANGWEAYSAAKMASNTLMEPYREEHGQRRGVRQPGHLPGRSRGHGGGQRVLRTGGLRQHRVHRGTRVRGQAGPAGQIRGPANVQGIPGQGRPGHGGPLRQHGRQHTHRRPLHTAERDPKELQQTAPALGLSHHAAPAGRNPACQAALRTTQPWPRIQPSRSRPGQTPALPRPFQYKMGL